MEYKTTDLITGEDEMAERLEGIRKKWWEGMNQIHGAQDND